MNEIIENLSIGGERPWYASEGITLRNVHVTDGESALKECRDITVQDSLFDGKYPFWHDRNALVERCRLTVDARAPFWYSHDMTLRDCDVAAPKPFREMDDLRMENCRITGSVEALWRCRGVALKNTQTSGEYLFFSSSDLDLDHVRHDGKYSFQYVRGGVIRNSVLNTKDAFWHASDLTVYDSEIKGEYLGWYSKNLRLVRCRISGTQPLCYCENLILEDCQMEEDADLAFEYSSVQATVLTPISSVKNPLTGFIKAPTIGEIILDEHLRAPADCRIQTWENA